MNFSMKRTYTVYAALVVLIVSGAVLFALSRTQPVQLVSQPALRTIQLDGKTIRVEVADNNATRELGLGGHAPLAADQGMLFVFQQDGVQKFWMKGMTFPLDILWLSNDGTIIYIQPDLSPATYPQAFGPNEPARYVLEVNAGYAQQNGVKVGDKVQL